MNCDPPTTKLSPLSLHDALPIFAQRIRPSQIGRSQRSCCSAVPSPQRWLGTAEQQERWLRPRLEEHTAELQSQVHLVCRLLLESKKNVFGVHYILAQELRASDEA